MSTTIFVLSKYEEKYHNFSSKISVFTAVNYTGEPELRVVQWTVILSPCSVHIQSKMNYSLIRNRLVSNGTSFEA